MDCSSLQELIVSQVLASSGLATGQGAGGDPTQMAVQSQGLTIVTQSLINIADLI